MNKAPDGETLSIESSPLRVRVLTNESEDGWRRIQLQLIRMSHPTGRDYVPRSLTVYSLVVLAKRWQLSATLSRASAPSGHVEDPCGPEQQFPDPYWTKSQKN